jgi:Kef-type K+ transport system membrane component KefB
MAYALFTEISLIVVVAFLIASVTRLLRQPLIVGYIVSGLVLGPYLFGVIQSPEVLNAVSELGIALLLFIVGLGLNPKEVRRVGKPAVVIGVSQIIFTTLFGFILAQALGYAMPVAVLIALALTLSSTIVILKTISDKNELGRLYAKISIGFFLVQDIFAVGLLIYASSVGAADPIIASMTQSFTSLMAVGSLLAITAYYLLPRLSAALARSQEYLSLFALAWGLGVSALVAVVGLSIEIGALLAGILLSTQIYAKEISNRLQPLRDFFLLFFFVTLGASLDPGLLDQLLAPAAVFSAFVLLGNPLIVMVFALYFGYTKRTSFKSAMTVGQVSEFSLVFVLLAAESGLVNQEVVGLVTLVVLITVAGSTYMMRYDEVLYGFVSNTLGIFADRSDESEDPLSATADIFLLGYARNARSFAEAFQRKNQDFLVVDYDPEKTEHLKDEGIDHVYGDITDPELLADLRVQDGEVVISTIRDFDTNLFLTEYVSRRNPDMVVVVYSENPQEAAQLYENGATYVIMPHFLGGEQVLDIINGDSVEEADFLPYRDEHLRYIQNHTE